MVDLLIHNQVNAWRRNRPFAPYCFQGALFFLIGVCAGLFAGSILVMLTLLNFTAGVLTSLSLAIFAGWIFAKAMCSTANSAIMEFMTIPGSFALGIAIIIIALSQASYVYTALAMFPGLPIAAWLWSYRYK
ncbi:MAG: hypothetical protein COT26_02240 [Candidatus Kerfeldbacteria bacterium CG08_land_8_20_14_0_20_43_14]|uniref:Uncharacterized protein n=1 Tax=Candidatus Kerfeldbacteria bacterium CG08_land_8_20_14_0_20_43_14 TaxID=2014246 RepID=A0A2H0YQU8_9BACT|nr:MAG: hypothetical protein COT26_02240 [Candidatus Kerfeldbacteria bacterium CG08_land_8_20_14_0_20_43_14]